MWHEQNRKIEKKMKMKMLHENEEYWIKYDRVEESKDKSS